MSELNKGEEVAVGKLQVHNVGSYSFSQTGQSSAANAMGMREMQARAFEKRDSQYLLIQAPPACGKSRAVMFLALDKVINQGIKKVIIAVPQMVIGSSFNDTELSKFGFFADWHLDSKYNLCAPGGDSQKVAKAIKFLEDDNANYLLCSHLTFNFLYEKVKDKSVFNKALVAIDEFHHVSEEVDNCLGNVIHDLMANTSAHVIAMTGSYFRGDSVPVLSVEDEKKFDRVVYTYYEQLNGYKYLKSLGIDYAFYEGNWLDAVPKLLDLNKKTIIHIPNVNSKESTGDKYNEIAQIIDAIGVREATDPKTGIITVKSANGKILRVADLVSDNVAERQSMTLAALRDSATLNTVDVVIALNMGKEGFDWPQCEYALTVGYRSSLTEVVQIIGRATRDYPGKEHAQFTNLVAMPTAMVDDVTDAVNSLLKAITLSLLMEQVLAPNVHFKKRGEVEPTTPEQKEKAKIERIKKTIGNQIEITIDDDSMSDDALKIVNEEYADIVAKVINSSTTVKKAIANGGQDISKSLVAEDVSAVIRQYHPELSDRDIAAMSQAVVTEMIIKTLPVIKPDVESDDAIVNDVSKEVVDVPVAIVQDHENRTFVKIKDKFINVDELDFNMIGSINPFQDAYIFVSKAVKPELLKLMQNHLNALRQRMDEETACQLWNAVEAFVSEHGREPDQNSSSDYERRLGVVLEYVRQKYSEKLSKN